MIDGSPSPGALVAGAEPIPQAVPVGVPGLFRIGDQKGVLFGEFVHPGAGGEIGGLLLAAVQHDDQRHRLARDSRTAHTAGSPEHPAGSVWLQMMDLTGIGNRFGGGVAALCGSASVSVFGFTAD